MERNPTRIPPQAHPVGRDTLAEAGRIQNPRKLFRPAESFFRILNQDCFGKKFRFCSGDTAVKRLLLLLYVYNSCE